MPVRVLAIVMAAVLALGSGAARSWHALSVHPEAAADACGHGSCGGDTAPPQRPSTDAPTDPEHDCPTCLQLAKSAPALVGPAVGSVVWSTLIGVTDAEPRSAPLARRLGPVRARAPPCA